MRQTNASAAIDEDLLEVALNNERLSQAKARSPRLRGLVRTGIATLLGVLVTVMIVNEIFYFTLRKEIQGKQLAPTNEILMASRAREQSLLTGYQWIKKNDGIVRIPIKRAASLVIAEYARLASPIAAASASSTLSASSSANSEAPAWSDPPKNKNANAASGVDP